MNVLDLLKLKKMTVRTDVGVDVELQIKLVEQINNSEDLEPPSRSNDFYPPTRDWKTYKVTFMNGHSKIYHDLSEIKIID